MLAQKLCVPQPLAFAALIPSLCFSKVTSCNEQTARVAACTSQQLVRRSSVFVAVTHL